eukprot:12907580-Prorocentrum_lima.AAC.1
MERAMQEQVRPDQQQGGGVATLKVAGLLHGIQTLLDQLESGLVVSDGLPEPVLASMAALH